MQMISKQSTTGSQAHLILPGNTTTAKQTKFNCQRKQVIS
jgi:hypothetical protein